MPHSTRPQPSSNKTTMSRPSTDASTIEVDPERARLIGPATSYPLTNGHLTNGYHSDESNAAEEVQMHPTAQSVAANSSTEPPIHITTPRAGAGAGAVPATTQTYITGTTINGTNVNQTTINGAPIAAPTSSATVNGTSNNIDPTLIERAPPPLDEQEAEAAFAATVASVITSNANERTAITVNERTGSITLDTGVTKVYPRALFDINPTMLGVLLRREFGDPWGREPPVWVIEVLHDGSYKVTAPRALTDGEIRSCEGF